ncbi:hypothetical protein [Emticicia sp. 17c]|uniref:hypothetical protein n=1 Tax=Emticicia sp. 17c TaxID=3127704 RepID=UPI00301DBFEA
MYPVLVNVPTTYANLQDGDEYVIPSGSIQYTWKILNGTAKVNGVEYQEGIFDDQPYQQGLSYASIAFTEVTGEVIISYKKPATI